MTRVRRLIGAVLAVALGAWAGVVVAARRPRVLVGRFEDWAAKPVAVVETAAPDGPRCEGCLPDNQMESGDATLRIRLRGDADGLPVEMKVRLWRLGVEGNDTWTDGDEVRATLVPPKDGAVVDRLPMGRYRLECLDRRIDTEDPPEFTLSWGVTERDFAVPNRRWFQLRLVLVNEVGSPIVRAVREERGSSRGFSEPGDAEPEWATPRRSRDGHSQIHVTDLSGIACGGGGERTQVQTTIDGFFDLGRHQENSAWNRRWWACAFLTDARNQVGVVMWNEDKTGLDTTLVGVAARIDVLVARVTGPDGLPVDRETATIETWCGAVSCPWTPPADAWRTVPVHVKIVKPGCEPLEFDWTAATADAPHALVASPPGTRK